MVGSMDMKPRKGGPLWFFVKGQFLTRTPPLPKDIDLSGQVAIVTGASTGLGLHCARQLLALKLARLVMPVRSLEKGEAVAATFRADFPKAQVDVWPLEMTSYESVRAFVRKAEAELPRIDIAILNAGIAALNFEIVPATGHEKVIQVNYLSTFLLAILLLPVLKAKRPPGSDKPARLTVVNSGASLNAKFPNHAASPLLPSFDSTDVLEWEPYERYFSSKLLGHLVLPKLVESISPDDVIFNLVDPGLCKGTGLHREGSGIILFIWTVIKALTARTMDSGASTYVDAAVVKGPESHGCYVMDWEIQPLAAFAYTPEGRDAADRLWRETLDEFEFAGAREILASMSSK